jgi:hypothetical protein
MRYEEERIPKLVSNIDSKSLLYNPKWALISTANECAVTAAAGVLILREYLDVRGYLYFFESLKVDLNSPNSDVESGPNCFYPRQKSLLSINKRTNIASSCECYFANIGAHSNTLMFGENKPLNWFLSRRPFRSYLSSRSWT